MAEESLGKQLSKELRGVVDAVNNQAKEIGAKVGEKVSHVLGPEIGELTEWTKSIGESAWDITVKLMGPFLALKNQGVAQFKALEEQNEILEEINERGDRQEKAERAKIDKKEGGFFSKILGALMLPLVLAAGVLGAYLKKIVLPFQLMASTMEIVWKILKPLRMVMMGIWTVIRTFTEVDVIIDGIKNMKIFALFGRFKTALLGFGEKFMGIIKWVEEAPFLGKLAKALKVGFRVFGWPLTVLMGVIDFIRGWMGEEGEWENKLTAGLTQMWKGFMDLPLTLFDWIMQWFGAEEGSTKSFINDAVSTFIKDMIERIKEWPDLIMDKFTSAMKFFQDEGFFGGIGKVFKTIMDWFSKGLIDWAYDNFGWLIEKFSGKSKDEMYESFGLAEIPNKDSAVNDLKKRQEQEAKKIALMEQQARFQKRMAEQQEKQKPANVTQTNVIGGDAGSSAKIAPAANEDPTLQVAAGGWFGL